MFGTGAFFAGGDFDFCAIVFAGFYFGGLGLNEDFSLFLGDLGSGEKVAVYYDLPSLVYLNVAVFGV